MPRGPRALVLALSLTAVACGPSLSGPGSAVTASRKRALRGCETLGVRLVVDSKAFEVVDEAPYTDNLILLQNAAGELGANYLLVESATLVKKHEPAKPYDPYAHLPQGKLSARFVRTSAVPYRCPGRA